LPKGTEDHKVADTGDYNLFRYVHNDPVDNVDPMGLAWSKADDPRYLAAIAATRELLGLSSTYIRAALSAQEGAQQAAAQQAATVPI
jgi:uncharacterized protein RhaS with RHS repeats